MKKATTMIVTIFLVLGLTACNIVNLYTDIYDARSEVIELKLWHYYTAKAREVFERQVRLYNETEGMEAGVKVVPTYFTQLKKIEEEALKVLIDNKFVQEMPDLLAIMPMSAFELYQHDKIANLSEYTSVLEREEFVPAFLEDGMFDDNMYLYPYSRAVYLLYLNKTDWLKLKSETEIEDEHLATWQGIFEAAEVYYNWTDAKTPERYDGKAFISDINLPAFIASGNLQQGVTFLNKGSEISVHLDESAFRNIWDIYYGLVSLGYLESYARLGGDNVRLGKSLAYVSSSSNSEQFPVETFLSRDEIYEIDMEVFLYPTFDLDKRISLQIGTSFAVVKSTEEREKLAVDFLRWLTKNDSQVELMLETGYMTVKQEAFDDDLLINAIQGVRSLSKNNENKALRIEKSYEQVNIYTVVSVDTFAGSNVITTEISNALFEISKQGREEVLRLVEKGLSPQEAFNRTDPDGKFAQWIDVSKDILKRHNVIYKLE